LGVGESADGERSERGDPYRGESLHLEISLVPGVGYSNDSTRTGAVVLVIAGRAYYRPHSERNATLGLEVPGARLLCNSN
jgi:hypothetical protein